MFLSKCLSNKFTTNVILTSAISRFFPPQCVLCLVTMYVCTSRSPCCFIIAGSCTCVMSVMRALQANVVIAWISYRLWVTPLLSLYLVTSTRQHALFFSTGVARHPRAATQWCRLLLLAAYGLATAHALLCIVSGMTQQFFVFCPRWPWPLTLDLLTRALFLYSLPNRQVWWSYV